MHKRIVRAFGIGMAILLMGMLYSQLVRVSGRAVPCLFYLMTGWKCPGCGVTHMCMALLQLDFKTAFYSHPMLMVQLPILSVIALRNLFAYIKEGVSRLTRLETVVIYVCIVLLIGFAIVRNLALRF